MHDLKLIWNKDVHPDNLTKNNQFQQQREYLDFSKKCLQNKIIINFPKLSRK